MKDVNIRTKRNTAWKNKSEGEKKLRRRHEADMQYNRKHGENLSPAVGRATIEDWLAD